MYPKLDTESFRNPSRLDSAKKKIKSGFTMLFKKDTRKFYRPTH